MSSSRGKQSISIYTSHKATFRDAVERSASRELVLERLVRKGILQERFRKMKVGYERSVEMGRDLIERAFVKFRNERETDARGRERSKTVHVELER